MPIYEILIRGKEDGTISGSHAIDFAPNGMPGMARPIALADLKALVGSEFAGLPTQVAALTAERDALAGPAAQVPTLTAERDSLLAERNALAALAALVEPLKEQIRALKGTPKFNAVDVLKQLSDDEKEHITQFVADNPTLRKLWAAFLTRVTGNSISIDSETFLAALAGLKAALGEERVAEVFAAINIDVAEGCYIVSEKNP